VALADKLESLISFWSIGEKPTGSRDPFALRRAALGVIRIVVENKIRLPLKHFFKADDLMEFFAERLKVQVREKGVRHDVVDAVFATGGSADGRSTGGGEDDLVRLLARVEAVQSFLGSDAGKNLLTAYGRAANIVRAEERKDKTLAARIAGAPDPTLFAQDEEKALSARLAALSLSSRIESEDFVGAMNDLAGLRAPIDAFFEKVTVNVTDNDQLRLNRLKLLNQIRATMDSVADFSKIEG
jgi:glycyl-tRNA synthetase beta chain